MRNKKGERGFTLIELLVVIGIIALLSTLAVFSLNSARKKSRDAKRLADVRQIQTALELYYDDQKEYPSYSGVLGSQCLVNTITGFETSGTSACGSGAGIIYMGFVPSDPDNDSRTKYGYTATGSEVTSYEIRFRLEAPTAGLPGAQDICASPNGLGPCPTN